MAREEEDGRLDALAMTGARGTVTTVVGPPGVGKSRLARALAARRHGVVCALADARTEEELLAALATALGATGRRQDERGAFVDWLVECARDRTVVVLDDADGVLGPLADVAPKLAEACALVVTAREPLRIAAERRLAVEPLGPEAAARFFLERARDVYGPDAVPEADLELLPAVVEALDGLPLAVELAVSRLDAVDLRALHRSLGEKKIGALDLLRSGFRAPDPRHASLRAAFADVTAALDALPRVLLQAAAVFRGGFEKEDLFAVAAPDAAEDARLDAFATLRRRSLVHATPDGRFRLLHVVRELAEELGERDGDARRAHAAHFAKLARAAEPASLQEPSPRLRAERENLLAAWRFARDEDRALLPDLLRGLHPLLAVHGPRSLHVEVIAAAHDVATGTPDVAAHVLLRRAEATLHWDGASAQAVADLEAAATALRAAKDGVGLTRALLGQARLLLGTGQHDAYAPVADEALATARATGDATLVARALRVQARRRLNDDPAKSEALLREALRQVGEDDAPATRAEVLAELARAEINGGALEDAARHAAEALALHERLDSPHEITIVRLDLAMPLWELGRLDEARRLLAQSAEEARAQRAVRLEAFIVGYLGVCEAASGDVELALHALPLAVQRLDEHGDARHALAFRAWWAAAAALSGDADTARTVAAGVRDETPPLHHERSTELLLAFVDGRTAPESTALRTLEVRLAEQLASRGGQLREPLPSSLPAPPSTPALEVQRDGFFYVLPDGARIELDKRPILRRVLVTIARCSEDGGRASLGDVIDGGWPGERMHPDAAAHRAYMAISTLRRLGLRDRLRSVGDGYELVGGIRFVDPR